MKDNKLISIYNNAINTKITEQGPISGHDFSEAKPLTGGTSAFMTFQITTGEDNILTHDSYLRIGVRLELKNLAAATNYYMMNGIWYS